MEPERLDIGERARADLRFIRETMERASAFTAVPGIGWITMGLTALVAALLASTMEGRDEWILTWGVEGMFAATIGATFLVHKARRIGQSLDSGIGLRLVLFLLPGLVAASVLTLVFVRFGRTDALPGLWLLMYGVAIVTAGHLSTRMVSMAGLLFMALGGLAFSTPPVWGDFWMALGFGGVHVIFGWLIARRFNG